MRLTSIERQQRVTDETIPKLEPGGNPLLCHRSQAHMYLVEAGAKRARSDERALGAPFHRLILREYPMSTVYDPQAFVDAVVEHLASTRHIYDPVDHVPETDSQYRVVCLAPRAEDAWKIAHLLGATASGRHTYTVAPAAALGGDPLGLGGSALGEEEDGSGETEA